MTLRAPTFGVSLPNRAVMFGVTPQTLIDVAVGAEKTGAIDSVWVGDNFLSQPRLESLMLLAAIAARTRRVTLGTLCLATFAMRQPLQLAIQWASLDLLSGGRTILESSGSHASSRPAARRRSWASWPWIRSANSSAASRQCFRRSRT